MEASLRKASAVRLRFSQSLANRRQRKPGDGALDDPALRERDEAFDPIRAFDDFGFEMRQDAGQRGVKDRPLVGAVGEQLFEIGEQAEQRRQ